MDSSINHLIINRIQGNLASIELNYEQEYQHRIERKGVQFIGHSNAYGYIDCAKAFRVTNSVMTIDSSTLRSIGIESVNPKRTKAEMFTNGSSVIPEYIILDFTNVASSVVRPYMTPIVNMEEPLTKTITEVEGNTTYTRDTPKTFNILFLDAKNRVIKFNLIGKSLINPTKSVTSSHIILPNTLLSIIEPRIKVTYTIGSASYLSYAKDPHYTVLVNKWGPLKNDLCYINKNIMFNQEYEFNPGSITNGIGAIEINRLNLGSAEKIQSITTSQTLVYDDYNEAYKDVAIYMFDNQNIKINCEYAKFILYHINGKTGKVDTSGEPTSQRYNTGLYTVKVGTDGNITLKSL